MLPFDLALYNIIWFSKAPVLASYMRCINLVSFLFLLSYISLAKSEKNKWVKCCQFSFKDCFVVLESHKLFCVSFLVLLELNVIDFFKRMFNITMWYTIWAIWSPLPPTNALITPILHPLRVNERTMGELSPSKIKAVYAKNFKRISGEFMVLAFFPQLTVVATTVVSWVSLLPVKALSPDPLVSSGSHSPTMYG